MKILDLINRLDEFIERHPVLGACLAFLTTTAFWGAILLIDSWIT